MSEIAKVEPLLESSQVAIQVITTANPVANELLGARAVIRESPVLQEIFIKARADSTMTSERLADLLWSQLERYLTAPLSLQETCQYLADEFMQQKDAILLVSPETGKAFARITEADMYVPAPVARETGTLAQPLSRLRPDLESAIVQWQFGKGHEAQLLQKLAHRTNTDFLRQEGDPRLDRITRSGRKHIVEQLKEDLPHLLEQQGGISKEFWNLCEPRTAEEMPELHNKVLVWAHVVIPIVDPLTSNLSYDPYLGLKRQVGGQWIRAIAKEVARVTKTMRSPTSVLGPLPESFWIAEPSVAAALRGKRCLAVPGAKTIHLDTKTTPVVVSIQPNSYHCATREFLGRWEISASVEVWIHVDPKAVTVYQMNDVPEDEIIAEVL